MLAEHLEGKLYDVTVDALTIRELTDAFCSESSGTPDDTFAVLREVPGFDRLMGVVGFIVEAFEAARDGSSLPMPIAGGEPCPEHVERAERDAVETAEKMAALSAG